MTPVGLEPTIPGSVGRRLIHWATGLSMDFLTKLHFTRLMADHFKLLQVRCPQPQASTIPFPTSAPFQALSNRASYGGRAHDHTLTERMLDELS